MSVRNAGCEKIPEFRRQMVELARSGRDPDELQTTTEPPGNFTGVFAGSRDTVLLWHYYLFGISRCAMGVPVAILCLQYHPVTKVG